MNSKVTGITGSNTVPKNGITGKNHTQPGADDAAIAASVAGINKGGMRGIGLVAITIAEAVLKKKATDLSRDYYRTNKIDYDNFRRIHEGPIKATVQEAMSPTANPTYVADFYASAPAGMAKSSVLDKQWFEARRRVHRYATGLQTRIDYDFALQRAHAIIGGWNIGRRYEIAYADTKNNRRFDKIIEAGNIGIGVGNVVRDGMAASVKGLASAYDNIGDTVSTIGNGLAANTGYKAGRETTNKKFDKVTKEES